MRMFRFRALVIDDDSRMLGLIGERLGGMSVRVGKHELKPEISNLLVEVELDGSGLPRFTERTLLSLIAISKHRYDYILLDYSYSTPEKQRKQWNQDTSNPTKGVSNAHLLTVSDLKTSALGYARSKDDLNTLERFFDQRTHLLLRSFQHDREHDILGTYERREQNTRTTFSSLERLDALNGFAQIYDSDASLRDEMYSQSNRGRELYRNVATSLMQRYFDSAMTLHMARAVARRTVPRTTGSVSMLVIMVAALGYFVQALVTPLINYWQAGSWGMSIMLAALTLLGLLLGSFVLALVAEFGLKRLFPGSARDNE